MNVNYLTLAMIPFILLDLYYGYNEQTCTDLMIRNTSISFPMRTWLKVSGFTSMLVILIPILIYLLPTFGITFALINIVYTAVWGFFRLAWLIVGAVMFIGFLWPNNHCEKTFSIYMWVNLVVGAIQLIMLAMAQREISAEMDRNRNRVRTTI